MGCPMPFSSSPGLNFLNVSSVPSPSGDGQKYLQVSPGNTIAPGQEPVPVHRRHPNMRLKRRGLASILYHEACLLQEAFQANCTMKLASSRKASLMPPVQVVFSWAPTAPCTHLSATSSKGRNCILSTTVLSIPSLAIGTKYMPNRYL